VVDGEVDVSKNTPERGVSIGSIGAITNAIIAGGNVIVSALRPNDQANAKARQLLLDRVERTWIMGLLGARMASRAIFAVPLAVKVPAASSASTDIRDTIAPPANELFQHVLILGEPGAGKTIFLLGLVQKKLAAAHASAEHPIPVVINASAWRDNEIAKNSADAAKQFKSWLIKQVQTDYKIAGRIIEQWLETQEIELYLDGLDEVASSAQSSFVEALHAFQYEETVTIYITCRPRDYDALTARERARRRKPDLEILSADAIYQLLPLSDADASTITEENGRRDLASSLSERSELMELCRTPLFLALVMEIDSDVSGIGSTDALFEALINHSFKARRSTLSLGQRS
jgi:NACHT domain